jgi:hypothetical protein
MTIKRKPLRRRPLKARSETSPAALRAVLVNLRGELGRVFRQALGSGPLVGQTRSPEWLMTHAYLCLKEFCERKSRETGVRIWTDSQTDYMRRGQAAEHRISGIVIDAGLQSELVLSFQWDSRILRIDSQAFGLAGPHAGENLAIFLTEVCSSFLAGALAERGIA